MPLDSFQQAVLEGFFRREGGFFLTGGAALAGFHLGHRATKDLDLFTTEDRLEDGASALIDISDELGATLEELRTAPTFRRFLLRRGDESVIVDLVHDLAPQIFPDKLSIGQIRVDPPEEILANKLCALLARAEIRDIVDVLTLEKHGFSIEAAMENAAKKDLRRSHVS